MKKITILCATLVLAAMVGNVYAQRAWAYDLKMTQDDTSYKFTFTSVSNDVTEANLVFTDTAGVLVGKVKVENVIAGANTITLTEEQIPGEDVTMIWAVELTAPAITSMTEITDADQGIYNFYLPQGVAVDNNPESNNFGKIYIAEATDGASDGATERTKAQKRGVFTYDPLLNELNTTNVGYVPANVTLTDATRQAMHRIAVRPTDGVVAFAYNVAPTAIWTVPATGDAVNLIGGITDITLANSLCFDENGALYVMNNANTTDGGTIYKVEGTTATKVIQSTAWGNQDNSMASDGRGGLWVAQHRWAIDAYNILTHINAAGEIDYAVNKSADAAILALFDATNNASYRGQLAYNAKENVIAFGGNKVVTLFNVTYDATTGVPTLTKGLQTPPLGSNIDGLAFDYAGDLLVLSASAERFYKYALPTADNHIIVPAQKAQTIVKSKATSLEDTKVTAQKVTKIIRNGQVYILRGNTMYDMLGQEVR